MRLRSVWELTCAACGAAIVTETPVGVCRNCGTGYEIRWTAEYQPKPEVNRDLE